jgi:aryl-alcohol dehydrogenase-like predicted oxidoreductase
MSLGDDHAANKKLLLEAYDNGINFFDTADLYQKGANEISVGKALKDVRSEIILATKVGNQWRSDGSGWDWNPKKEYILAAAEESLKRLQTEYIDLYQLHGGTIDDPIDETIEAFEILKKQGKIRFYGISSIRPNVIREYVKRSNIVSVMMQYSLLDRRPEEECLAMLEENSIGVLARGSLAGGLLINKPASPYLNYSEHDVHKAAAAIKKASTAERRQTQTAINFVLNHSAITSAVVGIRSHAQLDEALASLTAPALSGDEHGMLDRSLAANKYEAHR